MNVIGQSDLLQGLQENEKRVWDQKYKKLRMDMKIDAC